MENIRAEIREIEKHVKSLTPSPAAQIAIISTAQAEICKLGDKLTPANEHCFAVLCIAKNRIIHSK